MPETDGTLARMLQARLAPEQAAAAARLLMAGNTLPGMSNVTPSSAREAGLR